MITAGNTGKMGKHGNGQHDVKLHSWSFVVVFLSTWILLKVRLLFVVIHATELRGES